MQENSFLEQFCHVCLVPVEPAITADKNIQKGANNGQKDDNRKPNVSVMISKVISQYTHNSQGWQDYQQDNQ